MSTSEKYVAAAYLVVFVAVLAWVAIIATKLARLEREAAELGEAGAGEGRAGRRTGEGLGVACWCGSARAARGSR